MLTPEQKAIRATGIGGSEIAAVVGLNPWMKPIDVYLRKLGLADDVESFHMQRGSYLEPGLRDWYAAITGNRVEKATTYRHPKFRHVLATPDGIVFAADAADPSAALELKFPGPRTAGDWGDTGTDQVPEYYLPQCVFEAGVTGLPRTDAAAFIAGELRIYPVAFNRDLAEFLYDRAEAFWRDHIEKRVPPPVDESASYADYIKSMHPRSLGVMLDSNHNVDQIAANLKETRAKLDVLTAQEAALENTIKAFIGDADGVNTALGKITWKSTKDGIRTDWEAVAKAVSAPAEVIARHTTIKPGHRTFLVPRTWKKEAAANE